MRGRPLVPTVLGDHERCFRLRKAGDLEPGRCSRVNGLMCRGLNAGWELLTFTGENCTLLGAGREPLGRLALLVW